MKSGIPKVRSLARMIKAKRARVAEETKKGFDDFKIHLYER
jgi:hypothetical protein